MCEIEFDEEMQRMLDERVRLELRCYADACEPEIRRDVEQRAREILARGGSREEAVGTPTQPHELEKMNDPPYLTRAEEEWILSHKIGDEVWIETYQNGAVLVVAVVVGAVMLYFTSLFSPGLAFSLVRQFAIMAPPWAVIYVFGPQIRKKAVDYIGPVGCVVSDRRLVRDLALLYMCALLLVVLYLFPIPVLGFFVALFTFAIFADLMRQYFQIRKRIHQQYRTVARILELPAHDQL